MSKWEGVGCGVWVGGSGLSPLLHTSLQSLACALVREGIFLKDDSVVLGLFL